MPRLILTARAASGLKRCREFLAKENPAAAERAGETIRRSFELLGKNPSMGRPMPEHPGLRECVIAFGGSGYVAAYRYEPETDAVIILAFRHQKEAGFR